MVTTTELLTLPDTANHHDHEYHQLVFGLEGNTEFDIQGRGAHVSLGQGCLVPSSTDHAFCGVGDNQIVVINIPTENIAPPPLKTEIARLFEQATYFTLDSQRQVLLQAISREIRQTPANSPLLQACGHTLLLSMQNHMNLAPKRRYLGAIDQAAIDQYIQLNLHRRLSVQELAGVTFMSPSHFHARFKEITNLTPHQYVLQKRLSEARNKLAQGWTILQTAEHCGFSSQSAFTHAFRNHFGITPSRCRKTSREH
ncbi:helix-turn-helix transcriptional regulator [Neptunomonas concharum]|uniref:Helix-turn-helix transcriptional regulator n=1 Tax=Neptunomonas concharum TaxID=1031538 RepID=A0A5P1R7C5_9GAMM|nr:AraC family transcriptional regulator [Neptunomonas concharum]QEQ95544.1 helix-turn-helix transcriptional regulator [Neptunomonas concharum]